MAVEGGMKLMKAKVDFGYDYRFFSNPSYPSTSLHIRPKPFLQTVISKSQVYDVPFQFVPLSHSCLPRKQRKWVWKEVVGQEVFELL
jgi:hypothetical protein